MHCVTVFPHSPPTRAPHANPLARPRRTLFLALAVSSYWFWFWLWCACWLSHCGRVAASDEKKIIHLHILLDGCNIPHHNKGAALLDLPHTSTMATGMYTTPTWRSVQENCVTSDFKSRESCKMMERKNVVQVQFRRGRHH